MNDQELERKLHTALEHAAPDDVEAVLARLAINKFSGKLLQRSMEKQPAQQRTAVYRALFPFKALQIKELPTALKVMGAEMQFIE